MADLIDEYEVYLERERHASANTVCSYVRDVRQFDGYLRAGGEGTALAACTAEHVRQRGQERGLPEVFLQLPHGPGADSD